MSQLSDRIAQFRKMATDDPENELGHFRLGQLLMEDLQFQDATQSLHRTLEITPQFSKVYQLLGECLIKLDRTSDATEILLKGYAVADERGDKMPRDAMGMLLTKLGQPIPESATPAVKEEYTGPDSGFRCQRPTCPMGKRARQLTHAPLTDAVGQRVYATICADCWNDWFKNYSVKVINELKLDLSTEFGQGEYDKYLRGFMGWDDEGPPPTFPS